MNVLMFYIMFYVSNVFNAQLIHLQFKLERRGRRGGSHLLLAKNTAHMMAAHLLLLACTAITVGPAGSQRLPRSDPPGTFCTGGPDADAAPNLFKITSPKITHGRDAPRGRLFTAHHTLGNTSFPVLHLYGTPYEWGVAQGTLLGDEARAMWAAFWEFLVQDSNGDEAQLNKTLAAVERTATPFIPQHFVEEIRGLADATGVSYQRILWLHLYPETAGGHCSMFGAWGAATASTGGELLQLRALLVRNPPFSVRNPPLWAHFRLN